jgi:hypothetical protein
LDSQIRYEVDMSSPFVTDTLSALGNEGREKVMKLLRLIAADLPLDSMFVDLSDHQERVDVDILDEDSAVDLIRFVVRNASQNTNDPSKLEDLLSSLPMLAGHGNQFGRIIEEAIG